MPTFTNPGPDGWHIPLHGIVVGPGETVTVDEAAQATIDEDTLSTDSSIEAEKQA